MQVCVVKITLNLKKTPKKLDTVLNGHTRFLFNDDIIVRNKRLHRREERLQKHEGIVI